MSDYRVYLRAFDHGDVADRTRWMNDPEFRRMLNAPFPVSEISTRKWLERISSDPTREDMAICLIESDRLIGYTGFRDIDLANQKAEQYSGIGEKEYWWQGLGLEATLLGCRHIFSKYNLNKIIVKCRSENLAILRMYAKAGFQQDGIAREDLFSHGQFRDIVVMSILRREFFDLHGGGN